MFKEKWFVFAVVATVFLGLCILFSGGIYTTVGPVGGVGFYRVNRFTGESWLARPSSARKVLFESETKKVFVDDLGLSGDRKEPKDIFDELSPGAPKPTKK